MKRTFWAKQKLINALDAKAVKLSEQMETADGDELVKLVDKLDQISKLKESLKKPKISKEVWVEVLKIVGVAAALGAVMYFDAKGHVMPKNLEKWIPGPRL